MAHIFKTTSRLQTSKPLPAGISVKLSHSPVPLMQEGFNIPVTVCTASSIKNADPNIPAKAVTVMAHFDTGASRTSIDTELANYIGLIPVGKAPVHTASGIAEMPNFAVDISFPNYQLQPFINLPIGSCKLPLKINPSGDILLHPNNFGLLIGRDIMSK